MRGYLDTRRGQVHCRRAPGAGPAVVLLHETPLSSQVFERALPHLGSRLDAWALDTPGYGLSDPPEPPATIEDYADRLLEALDVAGLERVCVFGTHTGASIAVELALRAGIDRVTSLVLCGVPILDAEERAAWLGRTDHDLAPRADGSHLADAWAHRGRTGGAPPDLVNLGVVHVCGNERYAWGYRAVYAHDVEPLLPQLTVPVLLLNTEDDSLVESDRAAVGLIPGARLRLLPAGARKPYWQAPETFARELADFVTLTHKR